MDAIRDQFWNFPCIPPNLYRLQQVPFLLLWQSESSWIINMGVTAWLLFPDISFFTFQCFLCVICHYLILSFSFSLTIIIQRRKCSTDWEFIQHEWTETFDLATSAEDQESGCLQDPGWQSPSWSLCKPFKVKDFIFHTDTTSLGGQFLCRKERVNYANTDAPTCSYAVLAWRADASFRFILITVTTQEIMNSTILWSHQCIAWL